MKTKETQIKNTAFRAWKSGKNWLYTSTAFAVTAGAIGLGATKAKADVASDIQTQIALASMSNEAATTPATIGSTAPVSAVAKTAATASMSLASTVSTSSVATASMTSLDASATAELSSAFDSLMSASPELASLSTTLNSYFSANPSAMDSLGSSMTSMVSAANDLASSAMSSFAANSSAIASINSVLDNSMAAVNSLMTELSSETAAISSSLASTVGDSAAIASSMAALSSIADLTTALSNAIAKPDSATLSAFSEAYAAAKTSPLLTSYVAGISKTLAATSTTTTTTSSNPLDFLGGITGTLFNAISGIVGFLNPVNLLGGLLTPLLGMGQIGQFAASLIGSVVTSTVLGVAATGVGALGANLISLIPAVASGTLWGLIPILGLVTNGITTTTGLGWIGGIAGWLSGSVGAAVGGYYGGTSIPGMADSSGHVSNIVGLTSLGAALGGVVGTTLAQWIVTYPLAHIMAIPGALFAVAGIIGTISTLLNFVVPLYATWWTPLLDTISSAVGTPIGAIIGGTIGGALGFILDTVGIQLNLPDAATLVKDVASLPGISDLLQTIVTVTNTVPAVTGAITLSDATVAYGGTFVPSKLFSSAKDAAGNAVAASLITVTGTINTKVPGKYVYKYSFVDPSNGATVTNSAIVTVAAKTATAGAMTLTAQSQNVVNTGQASVTVKDLTVSTGSIWTAKSAFVSATDSTGAAVAVSNIQVIGRVDTRTPGVYPVIYSFTDAATGAVITKTALITVKAQTVTANVYPTAVALA